MQNYLDNAFFFYQRNAIYILVMVKIMETFNRKHIYRLCCWLFIPYYIRQKKDSSTE